MKSFFLSKHTYKPLSLKVVIISWVASFLSLVLFWVLFLPAASEASWAFYPDRLLAGTFFFFISFIFYNLVILPPMALIAKKTGVNPIRLTLIMYVPFVLLIIDIFTGVQLISVPLTLFSL